MQCCSRRPRSQKQGTMMSVKIAGGEVLPQMARTRECEGSLLVISLVVVFLLCYGLRLRLVGLGSAWSRRSARALPGRAVGIYMMIYGYFASRLGPLGLRLRLYDYLGLNSQ